MPASPAHPRIHLAAMATLLLLAACGRPDPSPPAQSETRRHGELPPTSIAAPLQTPATGAATSVQPAHNAADAQGATDAAGTVHAYLQALASARLAHADAMWANGMPGSRRDDAVLRDGRAFDALRIASDAPIALDRETPPRAYEIPVHLRFARAGRTQRIDGWYRLRLSIDGRRWEITGAALQPVLD